MFSFLVCFSGFSAKVLFSFFATLRILVASAQGQNFIHSFLFCYFIFSCRNLKLVSVLTACSDCCAFSAATGPCLPRCRGAKNKSKKQIEICCQSKNKILDLLCALLADMKISLSLIVCLVSEYALLADKILGASQQLDQRKVRTNFFVFSSLFFFFSLFLSPVVVMHLLAGRVGPGARAGRRGRDHRRRNDRDGNLAPRVREEKNETCCLFKERRE